MQAGAGLPRLAIMADAAPDGGEPPGACWQYGYTPDEWDLMTDAERAWEVRFQNMKAETCAIYA